jgi:hypothetical protein
MQEMRQLNKVIDCELDNRSASLVTCKEFGLRHHSLDRNCGHDSLLTNRSM